MFGQGGNIGLSVGDDGVVVIDTQFAELSEQHQSAINTMFPGVQTTLTLNTHYHGDHTGGNAHWAAHAHIISHHNVRERLADKPEELKPDLTYGSDMMVYLNGQEMQLVHPGAAHTDGDTAVIWAEENVVHTGDLFFKDRFPYIDLDGGGSVMGYLDAVSMLLESMDDQTRIIPGHGELANKADYERFQTMLEDTIAWMNDAKANGITREALLEQGVPAEYKSWAWQFIGEDRWINTLYNGL
jgi:glyoxylase-like metal-dependent hydrolase (beta-lactamase superfamily II)